MNHSGFTLRVEGLTKRFGGVAAVSNMDFVIEKGKIVAVVGPNGSGKTTLINLISGFLKPDEGSIRLEGKEIAGKSPHKITNYGIARTFQVLRPFFSLPACHNVVLSVLCPRSKTLKHLKRFGQAEQLAMDLVEMLGFERRHDAFRPTRSLPPGHLRRLDIARALGTEPKLLLLDEPFSELTSTEAVSVRSTLLKLNAEGLTILVIEHRLGYITDIVHRVIVMHQAQKVVEGTAEEVMRNKTFRELYYG